MKTIKTYAKPEGRLLRLATVILTIAAIVAFAGCSGENAPSNNPGNSPAPTIAAPSGENPSPEGENGGASSEGDDLVIPVGDITEQASFYPVEIDGTRLEVLAVKAPDGTIRTAFNTCEICYDSGRGYYEQEGDALVCQNCGNRFKTSQIEVESNGCNPWPIFSENKTVDDETITISYDFLQESISIFRNWKGNA